MGRPKGAEKTVIGLPRKKRKQISQHHFSKSIQLIKKGVYHIATIMSVFKHGVITHPVILLWFVSPTLAERVLARKWLIDEDQIEIIPERITVSCLDENVCLSSCKKYFTDEGWLALESLVAAIAKSPRYFCGRCTNPIDDDTKDSILCESCLIWYHYQCMNIKKKPKSKHWFCRSCY